MMSRQEPTPQESPLWQSLDALPPSGLGVHRYLLVNQGALQGQAALVSRLLTLPHHALLGQDADACSDGVTPFLLRIDTGIASHRHQIAALVDAACYASALSVIDSALELRDLARVLTARTEVLLSDDMPMLLRFFDTRVLFALLETLTEAQCDAFLSCAVHWWAADREGAIVPCTRLDAGGVDAFTAPLRLTTAQEVAMITASEPDAVMDLLTTRGTPRFMAIPYPARYPVVRAIVERARGWGLRDLPDMQSFAMLCMLAGMDFDQREPWAALLPEVSDGRLTFNEALHRVAEQEE